MRSKKILIMGLPGAGKTTLAKALLPRLNAVHFNADEVRANIHKDLSFSLGDRLEHARRMGWLCEEVARTGAYAIADFICPTDATRVAFGEAFTVWVDRISAGRFADTNRLFEPPTRYDIRVTPDGTRSTGRKRSRRRSVRCSMPRSPPRCWWAGTNPSMKGTKPLSRQPCIASARSVLA